MFETEDNLARKFYELRFKSPSIRQESERRSSKESSPEARP